jgi:hypothetical protein
MDEQSLTLLKKIVSLKSVSIYDLAESYSRETGVETKEIFDEVTRIVYELASKTLIKLETVEGEDGLEIRVISTPTGEAYVKAPALMET